MENKIDFYAIQIWDETESYKHVIADKKLLIYNNGKLVITLQPDDVIKMLKALKVADHSFMKGYW